MPSGYTPRFCARAGAARTNAQRDADNTEVNNAKRASPIIGVLLRLEIGQPSEGAQPRHEAVFAAARDYELRDAIQPFSYRLAWHCKTARVRIRSGDRIFIIAGAEENAIVDPFGLNELELSSQVCSYEGEHQSALSAVVFSDTFGKRWTVRCPAPDHPVYARETGDLSVARVAAPDVRAARSLKSYRVVCFKKEIVIAMWVCAQRGVVVKRTKRERRTATPAAHHFRRQQLLRLWSIRLRRKKPAKLRHTLVQL